MSDPKDHKGSTLSDMGDVLSTMRDILRLEIRQRAASAAKKRGVALDVATLADPELERWELVAAEDAVEEERAGLNAEALKRQSELATVVYAAGFSTVPDDLKQAAVDAFRAFYLEASRDPLVKSERVRVDDIDEVERQFWVGAIPGQAGEGPLPATVTGQLQRYRNYKV